MSKLFFDHLINLENIETQIKNITQTPEEKEELWDLIDGLIQIRVLDSILGLLPEEHHHDFLCRFHECPYDEAILQFVDDLVREDIEEIIVQEVMTLKEELLQEILDG